MFSILYVHIFIKYLCHKYKNFSFLVKNKNILTMKITRFTVLYKTHFNDAQTNFVQYSTLCG